MSKWQQVKLFFLWLLPARKVKLAPEVCSKCGTSGCLEDAALDR
jgi:hypothetical protein